VKGSVKEKMARNMKYEISEIRDHFWRSAKMYDMIQYVDDSSELSYNVGTVQLDRAVSSLRLRINGPLKLK
jgi:hypothetical protein